MSVEDAQTVSQNLTYKANALAVKLTRYTKLLAFFHKDNLQEEVSAYHVDRSTKYTPGNGNITKQQNFKSSSSVRLPDWASFSLFWEKKNCIMYIFSFLHDCLKLISFH